MKQYFKKTVCLLLALVLCAGLLPAITLGASAATLQERQQAIVAVAWAYYDKGHYVQYDGTALVEDISRADLGKSRSTNQVPPEYATPNETMFTVCSDFAHQCYWEAYRYQLTRKTAGHTWTGSILDIGSDQDEIPNNPVCVFHWGDEKDKKSTIKDGITEILSICQPGDVITVMRNNGHGHTMVYVGDVLGDGKAYLLHSTGSHMSGDKEVREYKTDDDPRIDPRVGKNILPESNGGSICLSEADSTLRNRYEVPASAVRMNVIRPLVSMPESEYPITPATKYRMSHPRLSINRTLNLTRMNSAYTGETVTMTLELANNSTTDYTVPVTEKAPAGAKIKKAFEGANLSGDTMKMDVALKAGETKTFTAEYEITAVRGETVVFDGGSVGDIPSNSIPITVGGKKLTDEENAKIAAVAKGEYHAQMKEGKVKSDQLGNFIYQKVLGLNVTLPDHKTVATKLIQKAKTPSDITTNVFLKKDEVAAENLTAFQMLVPTFRAGTNIWNQWGIERCTDPRDKYLEPGDVIVRSNSFTTSVGTEQLVYLGNGKYLYYDSSRKIYKPVEEPEFFRSMNYKVFYVLRPTLAYDDIHALGAPPKEFKFTDVKKNDWFYTYVKDLVEDGTVNGMTETTFVPNGTLTYGQALKLITLAVGEKEQEKTGTHWASGYLTLAKSKGWLAEDVNLDGTITRLQLCKVAAKAKGLTEQPASNPFKDTDDKDVLALNKAGVINGMTATEFQPNGLLTRAQISKIIWTLRKV